METPQDQIKFMAVAAQVEIGISTKLLINLETINNNYGKNYNTIVLTNTSAIPIRIYLDGVEMMYLGANGAVWSFDWKDGITFSQLEILNTSAAAVITADLLKISIGRTGVK